MNRDFFEKNQQMLSFQRNVFAALSLLVSVAVIILTCFLFTKRERVIVTPAVIEKEFWVDSNTVSPTYLEQFGYFLGQLVLTKSSYSASSQRSILLRHTNPAYMGTLNKKLIDEEETLKKQNASYVFFPIEVNVDLQKMEVLVVGDRVFYTSGKQVSSEREGYVLGFAYSGSRLLLNSISNKSLKS